MTGALIVSLGGQILTAAIWYLIGRERGREVELKKAWPYIKLAAPIMRALRIDEATEVRVTVTRTGPDEWTASQEVDRG